MQEAGCQPCSGTGWRGSPGAAAGPGVTSVSATDAVGNAAPV